MRISDWSSDVCSSDLVDEHAGCALGAAAQFVGQPAFEKGAHLFAKGGERGVGHRVHRSCLGSVLDYSGVEAPKWRTDRAERRAARAGCPCKRLSGRDGSHLDVPKGFDQNGPLLRQEVSEYQHIPSPSLLALGHFASNLDAAVIEYGP